MTENLLGLLNDIRAAREQGVAAIEQRQRARFAAIVAFARANSPYYRDLYWDLPEGVDDPRLLPITDKKSLMARFDDWVTDREVTLAKVRAFVENPDMVGEMFLGKYLTALGSGTRGFRAIYLMDNAPGPVYAALTAYQAMDWFPEGELLRVFANDGGKATVIATNCNFPIYVNTVRKNKNNPRLGKKNRILSVHTPLPELVAQLNEFRPVVLEGYASTMGLLASEQEAGRLQINPMLIIAGGEKMSVEERERIATVFKTKVGEIYGSSECPNLGYSCEHGWLHIHNDWVVFEPVDANYQPTPAGELSHTVLVSNLCNHAQPFLRYDLGDSVMQRPDPCPCGSPLPAIRVLGRAGDELIFSTEAGEPVTVNLIMISTEVDRTPGIDLFQFVQTSPTSMSVRMLASPTSDPERVWLGVFTQIKKVLATYNLDHVAVVRAEELPELGSGGKYRVVISQINEAALR